MDADLIGTESRGIHVGSVASYALSLMCTFFSVLFIFLLLYLARFVHIFPNLAESVNDNDSPDKRSFSIICMRGSLHVQARVRNACGISGIWHFARANANRTIISEHSTTREAAACNVLSYLVWLEQSRADRTLDM